MNGDLAIMCWPCPKMAAPKGAWKCILFVGPQRCGAIGWRMSPFPSPRPSPLGAGDTSPVRRAIDARFRFAANEQYVRHRAARHALQIKKGTLAGAFDYLS